MIAAAALGLAFGGIAAAIPTLAASAATIGTPVITDSLSGTVTGPDAIMDCATPTPIAIGGTEAIPLPVACLSEYNGEWFQVSWSGSGVSTKLTQQTDGNFVLYAGNGKVWGGKTRFADNANGPGCVANFQGDANLVVRSCDGTAIFASGTHTYPNAVLAFQADGNLVIYDAVSTHKALWSTGTN
jgi:hypothetical protein